MCPYERVRIRRSSRFVIGARGISAAWYTCSASLRRRLSLLRKVFSSSQNWASSSGATIAPGTWRMVSEQRRSRVRTGSSPRLANRGLSPRATGEATQAAAEPTLWLSYEIAPVAFSSVGLSPFVKGWKYDPCASPISQHAVRFHSKLHRHADMAHWWTWRYLLLSEELWRWSGEHSGRR